MIWWGAWGRELVAEKISGVWDYATKMAAPYTLARFTFNTAVYTTELMPAFVRMFYSALNHPPAKRLFKDMLIMGATDLSFCICMNFVNDKIQENGLEIGEQIYLSPISVHLAQYLSSGLNLAIHYHFASRFAVRTMAIAVNVLGKLPDVELPDEISIDKLDLCSKEKHKLSEKMNRAVMEVVNYYASKAMIGAIGRLPLIGRPLEWVFIISHNGRYFISMGLTGNNCLKHKAQYLKAYPSLAIAFGLSHWGATHALSYTMELFTGIPRKYYQSFVDDFLVLFYIGLSAHFAYPKPKSNVLGVDYNPIALYETGLGYIIETAIIGVKNNPPQWPGAVQQTDFWHTLSPYGSALVKQVPTIKTMAKWGLVPMIFCSEEALRKDPVIGADWENFRKSLEAFFDGLEKAQGKLAVKIVKHHKKKSALVIYYSYGLSPSIVMPLLALMNYQPFMESVHRLKLLLVKMNPEKHAVGEVQIPHLLQDKYSSSTEKNTKFKQTEDHNSVKIADSVIHPKTHNSQNLSNRFFSQPKNAQKLSEDVLKPVKKPSNTLANSIF